MRHAPRGRAAVLPLRPRVPLPLARVEAGLRGARRHPLDVQEGTSPDNAAAEGFFGRLKNEFFYGRDWRGVTAEEFMGLLDAWMRFYREGRLRLFDDGGGKYYDTIDNRRRRLGLAA